MTAPKDAITPASVEAKPGSDLAAQSSDGWSQLMKVLDKVPFVAGVKRDVSSLRRLVAGRRAPRLAFLGTSGSGRSRLINGLLGSPVLRENENRHTGAWVHVDAGGRMLEWAELLPRVPAAPWPRGVTPDVLLLVATPQEVEAGLGTHLEALVSAAASAFEGEPKVVAVLTKSDTLAEPSEEREPNTHRLDLTRQRFERQLRDAGLPKVEVFCVSVPDAGAQRLGAEPSGTMALAEFIAKLVPDEAAVETARAFAAPLAQSRVADSVIQSSSTLALTVALAPVPLSDIALIAPLQGLMVSTIAHLGGRSINGRGASEWIASVGVAGGVGLGFRTLVRQVVKVVPGAGSVVAAGIAGAGTLAIGRSAKRYFLGDIASRTGK